MRTDQCHVSRSAQLRTDQCHGSRSAGPAIYRCTDCSEYSRTAVGRSAHSLTRCVSTSRWQPLYSLSAARVRACVFVRVRALACVWCVRCAQHCIGINRIKLGNARDDIGRSEELAAGRTARSAQRSTTCPARTRCPRGTRRMPPAPAADRLHSDSAVRAVRLPQQRISEPKPQTAGRPSHGRLTPSE